MRRSSKQLPFFSKLYPIYNQQRKQLKTLTGHVYDFSMNQVYQNNTDQNTQKPVHKFFRVTILSVNYAKNINTDVISLNVYNYTINHHTKLQLH